MSTPPVPPADKGVPEHDPTGIRDLLSALPDPGPMPSDLVARITASIAAEQSAREQSAREQSARERSTAEGATVLPLPRRRWGWQQVGVAAAVVAILGFGLPALLSGTGPGAVLASLSGRGSAEGASSAAASAESGANSASSGLAPRNQSSGGDLRASGSLGQVTLAASGTAYTMAALATQARAVPFAAGDKAAAPRAYGTTADTENGLRACLTAIGVPAWMPVRGDVATLDGRPAVVAVVSNDTGQTVYAVAAACDATHPLLLAGPVAVP